MRTIAILHHDHVHPRRIKCQQRVEIEGGRLDCACLADAEKKYAEEYSKYYKELANSIRTRGDAWGGKAALGIGTAVLAAVGIGNIANLFSVRDFEILQLILLSG